MVQLFGRGVRERRELGGSFPCPNCGDLRSFDEVTARPCLRVAAMPVRTGRSVRSMRCRTCESVFEPLVEGELNDRQVAEWNHRVERLVARVGVAAGGGSDPHRDAARDFLLGRNWFTFEVDGVVGWASEVPPDATSAFVDELVVALEALATSRRADAERAVEQLAVVLAAGGSVDGASTAILERCRTAAGVEEAKRPAKPSSTARKRPVVAA